MIPNKMASLLRMVAMTMTIVSMAPKASLRFPVHFVEPSCAIANDANKFNCFPETNATEEKCRARGCCWQPVWINFKRSRENEKPGIPFCYYPTGYSDYKVVQHETTPSGYIQYLQKDKAVPHWPRDVLSLKVIVDSLGERMVRVRIVDPNATRFEPPVSLNLPTNSDRAQQAKNHKIRAAALGSTFGIEIYRDNEYKPLFQTSLIAPLLYTDQFLQISNLLSSQHIYGVGERQATLKYDASSGWKSIALYARAVEPTENTNLYGVHNFLLGMSELGHAYGIFFLNSNPQEVVFQPTPAVTHRTIGGILDLFYFTANHPRDVVHDYYSLLGAPLLPPYWGLGFQLCRWGYNSTSEMRRVYQRNHNIGIPLDVQWVDIDYMDRYLDWTVDPKQFGDLGDFVNQLQREHDVHFVVIVDPGISNQYPRQYPPYDHGLTQGIFVNHTDRDEPIVGEVWPGSTVFPDFSNPRTLAWWSKFMATFYHEKVAFDGLWIDMNEPCNLALNPKASCPNTQWDKPPYTPNVLDHDLVNLTVCLSARATAGRFYDTHNLYGYFQAKVTRTAMHQLFGAQRRVFLLSRSTFAGSGRYTFHWTGDVHSNWENLYYSIVQMINFNFFAIPMIGADICGFNGNTTEELCVRWHQLGAFYPFMRNHNAVNQTDQDPAVWSEPSQRRIRDAIRLRYSLLPYLYTLLHAASTQNQSVVQPLFFHFPKVSQTFDIDKQFMWGEALMIAPVLQSAVATTEVFFPEEGHWCSIPDLQRTFQPLDVVNIPISMDAIPVFLRGGHILVTQGWNDTAPLTALTTVAYRQLPFTILACANTTISGDAGGAVGEMLWDDGETLDTLTKGTYNRLRAELNMNTLTVNTIHRRLPTSESQQTLGRVIIMGVNTHTAPTKVTINGQPCDTFRYEGPFNRLNVHLNDSLNLWDDITIAWS